MIAMIYVGAQLPLLVKAFTTILFFRYGWLMLLNEEDVPSRAFDLASGAVGGVPPFFFLV